MSKSNRFLDSLKQMVGKPTESVCATCQQVYTDPYCPTCSPSPPDAEQYNDSGVNVAYLVDLVSNHKIAVTIPTCKVGRDESNDIVVSGDQSISRQHLIISKKDDHYYVQDAGSRHGTFLNGAQIHAEEMLNDGDVLKFGVSLFWFVIEKAMDSEGIPSSESSSGNMPTTASSEQTPTHIKVKSSTLPMPSSPSSSTINEIPIIPNNMSLLDHLRLKTRSFDQSDLFEHQSAPDTVKAAPAPESAIAPAYDAISAYTMSTSIAAPTSTPSAPPATEPGYSAQPIDKAPAPALGFEEFLSTQAINPIPENELMGQDLKKLVTKYQELKEQIEQTQQHMQEVADQIVTINDLRSSLLGETSSALISACQKVFTQLGWQSSFNPQDGQELELKVDDQFAIARIVWASDQPERVQLGQLSMSQTRFWCEQGQEPKGILIVSKVCGDDKRLPELTKEDYQGSLSSYAAQKNVCMLTSAQVLAIYCDLVIKHEDPVQLREKIMNAKGWLEGFNLESPLPSSMNTEQEEDSFTEAL